MNLGKAKSYLNKINRLFSGFEEDGGDVSQIEKDLMRSYVREFYDSLVFEAVPATTKLIPSKPKVSQTKPIAPKVEAPKPIVTKPKVERPIVTPTPVTPSKSEPKFEIPRFEQKPILSEPKIEKPEPKVELPKVEPVTPKTETPPVSTTPAVTPVSFDEYDILFEEEMITSTIQRLGQSKISNLRSSMGINERFLIQNELFGGNSSKFNDAIDSFDSFDNFNQAKAYVMKVVAKENDWLDDKKVKRAQSFIRKVRRRYK